MKKSEDSGREIGKEIAEHIRDFRLAKGWTLDKLAEVTGLSKSYLSQIENCEKNPRIGTLIKIAFGLGEDIGTLLTGERSTVQKPKVSLIRMAERRPTFHPNAAQGLIYEGITYKKPDRFMDGYIVTLVPEFHKPQLEHEGQELAFVLDGRQEFIYDGQSIICEAGDCLYFDSNRPHMARSLDGKPAKILVVFCNPKQRG